MMQGVIRDVCLLAGFGLIAWAWWDVDPWWTKLVCGAVLLAVPIVGVAWSRNDPRSPH
ncbi:MAG: hypothetical protein U0990_09560 [Candidatus Nanopelagicales bacterium]|nr:hypothetical protein [Candidatus Nanopelagicales bacterium]